MKNIKNKLIYIFLIGASLFTFMFIVTCTLIGLDVDQRCQIAQERYAGDCTESLIAYLDDEQNSYKSRNSAVWALGQIGDPKAYDTLIKYYTGDIPSKEPLDKGISQYELKKAIKLTSGGFNATKIIRENIISFD